MIPARPDIVITGMGVACAVGTGKAALWEALSTGRDGIRPIERFSIDEFAPHAAGLWPAWDPSRPATALELACVAAREAWADARVRVASTRIDESGTAPARIALILGTCFGEGLVGFSELTEALARTLGAAGPCVTVSTACSSSTTAIGLGRDWIEEGIVDVVVAGGVDVLTREVFAGFHAIGALGREKCAPFGVPSGMSLGEGAGFVVLETAARAQARDLRVHAHVLGYGLSADAHHETAPDPWGNGVARSISAAIADAGTSPDAIDFVSAHGTGTDANDAAEWLGVRTALGAAAERVAISSTKSFLGHAQGASGVLELIALLLCLPKGLVPPTLRALPARPGAPPDPVARDRPRAHGVRHALKLSAAFGGANAALVIGREEVVRPRPAPRAVHVIGLSAVGPHGLDVTALEAALTAGRRLAGAVVDFDLTSVVRSAPSRGVDPSGKYVTAAAALALSDAGVVVKGDARQRSGLFTGATRMPARSVHDCRASIAQRGITALAVSPFTHMVMNAPAGTTAKLLALKGPLLALSAGRASGLFAIVRAAQHLNSRGCADTIVAGGVDELAIDAAADRCEGAALAVLRAGDPVAGGVTIERWGIAGPDAVDDAVAEALQLAPPIDGVFCALPSPLRVLPGGVDPGLLPLGCVDVQAFAGGADAAVSAFAFVLAVARLRRGEARRLLVVSSSDSLSCAVVVSGGPREP